MNQSNRFLELDVLRGLAALAVVFYHYTTRFNEIYGHSENLWGDFPLGLYGVQLFFLISGFVIFMTLERTREALDFVVSRFSRLYPTYWTAMILTFVIVSLATLPGRQVSSGDALINLSMIQFLFEAPHVDPVYWTLSVELSFYVIMLALYRAKLLQRIEGIAAGWLLLMILVAVGENHFGISVPQRARVILLLDYADLFTAGMMFYMLMKQGRSMKRYLILASCLLVQWVVSSWQLTLIVTFFFIVFYLAIKGRLSFIVWRPLVFLGTISYALYLVHQNIGYVIIRALYRQGINPNASIAIAIIVSLCLASAVTFLIEKPALQAIRTGYAKFRPRGVILPSVYAACMARVRRKDLPLIRFDSTGHR
ncbi:MAG: acyltransferase [Acidobacteria bacterium]|nr:acyltransferase [Acidobacteriota bacterium]